MTAYYNEIDPYAAQWLRNLIDAGHIARGDVDTRSIKDVRADDLRGFTQLHFFAGIGGWSEALRLASWPDDRPVWTGSCPCQPFSAAGAGKAADDERHLWPAWFSLIAERGPPVVFGEQVEAAIGWGWLDLVFADLESTGYACGATVLPAGGVGAPHIRNRVWFVAHADGGNASAEGLQRGGEYRQGGAHERAAAPAPAETDSARQQSSRRVEPTRAGVAGGMDNAIGDGRRARRDDHGSDVGVVTRATGAHFWSDAEWIACTDGRSRPVGPGSFPLGHGIRNRASKLRAYGNAIVPQVAAEFIGAAMTHQCERRENGKGEWICDLCKSLWFGELAKTDWRPSECRARSISSQDRQCP